MLWRAGNDAGGSRCGTLRGVPREAGRWGVRLRGGAGPAGGSGGEAAGSDATGQASHAASGWGRWPFENKQVSFLTFIPWSRGGCWERRRGQARPGGVPTGPASPCAEGLGRGLGGAGAGGRGLLRAIPPVVVGGEAAGQGTSRSPHLERGGRLGEGVPSLGMEDGRRRRQRVFSALVFGVQSSSRMLRVTRRAAAKEPRSRSEEGP